MNYKIFLIIPFLLSGCSKVEPIATTKSDSQSSEENTLPKPLVSTGADKSTPPTPPLPAGAGKGTSTPPTPPLPAGAGTNLSTPNQTHTTGTTSTLNTDTLSTPVKAQDCILALKQLIASNGNTLELEQENKAREMYQKFIQSLQEEERIIPSSFCTNAVKICDDITIDHNFIEFLLRMTVNESFQINQFRKFMHQYQIKIVLKYDVVYSNNVAYDCVRYGQALADYLETTQDNANKYIQASTSNCAGFTRYEYRHVTIMIDELIDKKYIGNNNNLDLNLLECIEEMNNTINNIKSYIMLENVKNRWDLWTSSTGNSTISGIIDLVICCLHEIGHQVHIQSSKLVLPSYDAKVVGGHFTEINQLIPTPKNKKPLTKHGDTNDSEYHAESFVAWILSNQAYTDKYPIDAHHQTRCMLAALSNQTSKNHLKYSLPGYKNVLSQALTEKEYNQLYTTTIHSTSYLIEASKSGDLKSVENAIQHLKIDPYLKDKTGKTALNHAIEGQYQKIIDYLMQTKDHATVKEKLIDAIRQNAPDDILDKFASELNSQQKEEILKNAFNKYENDHLILCLIKFFIDKDNEDQMEYKRTFTKQISQRKHLKKSLSKLTERRQSPAT